MRPIHLTTKEQEHFYTKISKTPNETGCLDWLASCNECGYGTHQIKRKSLLAHRIAWTLVNGAIPDGMVIAHRCDRPVCCNPEHLWLCTQIDNMHDMLHKGRRATTAGERHPGAKLTVEQVLEIRSGKFSGWRRYEIAQHFGISAVQVCNILSRKTWAHLDATRDAPHERDRNSNAKLTEQDVLAIRSDLYRGWTLAAIGKQFGICESNVCAILRRRTWTHI